MAAPNFEIPPASFIRLDLFPALLSGENLPNTQLGGVLDSRRLIVTDTKVLVLSDSQSGPELTHEWNLVDITGRATIGWTVETEELTFVVRRSTGCGCGSRLRGLHLYPGVAYQPVTDTK